MNRSVIVATFAVVSAGCSSNAKPKDVTPCVLPAADSVFALTSPLYPACAVAQQVRRLESNVHPDYPAPVRPGTSGCFSADIEVVVDSLGRPEAQTARIVKSTDQNYAESVLALVPLWKFTPAMRDNRPVRQVFSSHESISYVSFLAPAGTRPTAPPRSAMPPRCSP